MKTPLTVRITGRRLFFAMATWLCVLLGSTGFAEEKPQPELLDRPLRVLTANIWNYAAPYEIRMQLLRAQIAALDPDLIGFQEAGWKPGEQHQVKQLLAGMHYHIDHEAEGTDAEQTRLLDVAVASRWPIKRRAVKRLPGSGKVLAVEVAAPIPTGSLVLMSTFGTNRWQFDKARARELDAVALDAFVRTFCDPQGFPPIIAGDFDATPDSGSIRFLTGRQSLQNRSTHYYDAWEAAANPSQGYTWTTDNAYAKKTTELIWRLSNHHRRIDYVFLGSPHHYRTYGAVVSAKVVLNKPQGDNWPSDHLGVLVEIATQR